VKKMLIWMLAGIYFIVSSAGGGGFISPVMAMVCGFMVARNFADIVQPAEIKSAAAVSGEK
jgi:hypothetical protein